MNAPEELTNRLDMPVEEEYADDIRAIVKSTHIRDRLRANGVGQVGFTYRWRNHLNQAFRNYIAGPELDIDPDIPYDVVTHALQVARYSVIQERDGR